MKHSVKTDNQIVFVHQMWWKGAHTTDPTSRNKMVLERIVAKHKLKVCMHLWGSSAAMGYRYDSFEDVCS